MSFVPSPSCITHLSYSWAADGTLLASASGMPARPLSHITNPPPPSAVFLSSLSSHPDVCAFHAPTPHPLRPCTRARTQKRHGRHLFAFPLPQGGRMVCQSTRNRRFSGDCRGEQADPGAPCLTFCRFFKPKPHFGLTLTYFDLFRQL